MLPTVSSISAGTPRTRILTLKGDNLPYTDPPFSPGSGRLLKVAMIIRGKGRLVRPRFGKLMALLSRNNLTPGIIRGRIGRVVRAVYGRFRRCFPGHPARPDDTGAVRITSRRNSTTPPERGAGRRRVAQRLPASLSPLTIFHSTRRYRRINAPANTTARIITVTSRLRST